MIGIHGNRGMHMTFDNGLTISIQIGKGNYCSNRDLCAEPNAEMKQTSTKCNNCEIAIWNEEGKWFAFEKNRVGNGWVSTEEVAIWIDKVRRAKNINTIKRIK